MSPRFTFWASAPEAVRDRLPHCGTCGKWTYRSRKSARKAARALHPNDGRLQAYRCAVGRGWHYGHRLPQVTTPVEQATGGTP